MSLELVFEASRTLEKYRSGPLGNCLDGFCDWLLEQGFSRGNIRVHLSSVSHLNEFLAERYSKKLRTLSAKDVDAFFKVYPSRAKHRGIFDQHVNRIRWSVTRLVQHLQQVGHFESHTEPEIYEPVLAEYLHWMRDYRHVVPGTLDVRRHSLRQFLKGLGRKATRKGLAKLTPEIVEQFFLSYAKTAGPCARRSMQVALRTFLRFCLQKGLIQYPLDKAVPTLHAYKLATVPRGLTQEQARQVLDCVNRETPVGRRDYAILQLLYTYGVRGGQVRNLQLTDIHWSTNQILFKASKHGKDSLLPLTEEVGTSLLGYLQKARPQCACPEVFITARAPYHRIGNCGTLSEMVRRYIVKAKVNVTAKGAHAFRHCFATRMVQAGHPLKSVADVLGHRYLSTTFIYTKVDFNSLKLVALEWPEEVLR